ncbi:G1/S-specific cyclin-D2 [Armadillidium nasatum]|uniref:G1/S-specific cyclin-D2 n=1 Tax=Armadillidium nasatum TaxID=96803 RepID=A0A5N5T428_9CRUS|nr:G1/S-specific cyclin-D2 [Armadillidium nasatum]
MEALLCAESASIEGPIALQDPVLLSNPNVLQNMLTLQHSTIPPQNYFNFIQHDIKPFMRKLVATWMLERTQLQLVGAVCLLIASKIRQCRALSIELLAYYTENSVSYDEIKKWELVLLSKLGWDLSPVTAGDFLEHLLIRIPTSSRDKLMRRHASTFIALAATEPDFVGVPPSAIAVGAVVAAVRGLKGTYWQDVLVTLAGAVESDSSTLERVVQMIEETIERESALLPENNKSQQQQQQQPFQHTSQYQDEPLLGSHYSTPPSTPTSKQQPQLMEFYDGNETPTDITDIMF